MKFSILIMILFLVALPQTARSELTLEDLAKQCQGTSPKPTQPALGILMCMSYIGGALDQVILTDGLAVQNKEQSQRTICGPDQGKVEKLSSLVKFNSVEHPEMRAKPARSVLRGLIIDEFKCG